MPATADGLETRAGTRVETQVEAVEPTTDSTKKQEEDSPVNDGGIRKKRRYLMQKAGTKSDDEDELDPENTLDTNLPAESPIKEKNVSDVSESLETTLKKTVKQTKQFCLGATVKPPSGATTSKQQLPSGYNEFFEPLRFPVPGDPPYEEENESSCCECDGGGELVCCDTCIRAYHMVCLPQEYRPSENVDSISLEWQQWLCPVCLYLREHKDLQKRRGVLLLLRNRLAVSPNIKAVYARRFLTEAQLYAAHKHANEFHDIQSKQTKHHVPHHEAGDREGSHYHYLLEDMKKQQKPTTVEAATQRITRRTAAVFTEKKKETLSTGTTQGRMNVGPSFQVPQLPLSFLEAQHLGRGYESKFWENHRLLKKPFSKRVVYSGSNWEQQAANANTITPFSASNQIQSKSAEKNSSNLQTKPSSTFVDTEEKLLKFCRDLASKWPPYCQWPYSSEYAYKILQYCDFDSSNALMCIQDKSFDFFGVCQPPVRPYCNKWKPKDKRNTFPSMPFPTPQHVRNLYMNSASRPRTLIK